MDRELAGATARPEVGDSVKITVTMKLILWLAAGSPLVAADEKPRFPAHAHGPEMNQPNDLAIEWIVRDWNGVVGPSAPADKSNVRPSISFLSESPLST